MATAAKKKVRAAIDPNETSESRFRRLGAARTSKALKAIRAISKLTGKAYTRTSAQEDSILKAIDAAVTEVRDAFAGKSKSGGGFSL